MTDDRPATPKPAPHDDPAAAAWLAHHLTSPLTVVREGARRIYHLARHAEVDDWTALEDRICGEALRFPEEVAAFRDGDINVLDRAWERLFSEAFGWSGSRPSSSPAKAADASHR